MASDLAVTATFAATPPVVVAPHGTKITKSKINKKHHNAAFRFTVAGTVNGFQCALIRPNKKGKKRPKPRFARCKSAKTYTRLTPGKYTFEVRALNSAGPDPHPAIKKFKI